MHYQKTLWVWSLFPYKNIQVSTKKNHIGHMEMKTLSLLIFLSEKGKAFNCQAFKVMPNSV